MPPQIRERWSSAAPEWGQNFSDIYREFKQFVVPYALGSVHPGFMGWAHGGGNVAALLAELLAAGLNSNLGGRDHAAIEIERQVIRWTASILGYPEQASGVLVTGASLANFIGVLVARTAAIGEIGREFGLQGKRLVAYTSRGAHSCIARAMDMAGLGTRSLRLIDVDSAGRIDLSALELAIANDRRAGFLPFLVIGNAGTVDVGAVDDLNKIAELASREHIWFHVDGAFGALCALSPALKPLVRGIERSDSVALDYHKWGQVQYDAGIILVRDEKAHRAAFASAPSYLAREPRGLAAGHPWLHDFGPDLSRGFRALKVWATLKAYGTRRLARTIEQSCQLARELGERIHAEPELELLAPVNLNIVCFRYRGKSDEVDDLNREIVADVQESGLAVPSTTILGGKLAIRAALINHRTRAEDVTRLVDAVLRFGRQRTKRPLR
jgi:glutamate/tyrosine decarboxylase-like PLP-dependent enzyme